LCRCRRRGRSRLPNRLAEYRDARGLDNDAVASELSALLGKPISAQSVNLWGNKPKPPAAWAKALGLDPEPVIEEAAWVPPPAGDFPPPAGPDLDPPMMPPGARQTARPADPGGDYSLVRGRIAKAYNAVGAGMSMATRNDGYGAVTESYSDDIAQAWVAAARENVHVAKIVAFMESGGPVGELVVSHIILVLGFVYVSGRAPALHAIYGKFDRYHNAAAHSLAAEQRAADLDGPDGAAGNGSVGVSNENYPPGMGL